MPVVIGQFIFESNKQINNSLFFDFYGKLKSFELNRVTMEVRKNLLIFLQIIHHLKFVNPFTDWMKHQLFTYKD